MRNGIVLLSLITLIAFTSCKKDSPAKPLNDLLLSGGSWTITNFSPYLFDSAINNYAGYTLTFKKDGKMQMQSYTKTGSGTWRTYNSEELLYLSIDVQDDDFLYLESSWMVSSMNSTRLELSAGLLVSSYMTLSKN